MNIRFDESSGGMFIRLDETKKIIESQEVAENIILDFDRDGNVVGIELLKVTEHISTEKIKDLSFKIV